MHIRLRLIVPILLLCAACQVQVEIEQPANPIPQDAAAIAAPTEPVVTLPAAPQDIALLGYTNAAYNYAFNYPATSAIAEDAPESVWVDNQIHILISAINPELARGGGIVIDTSEDTLVGTSPARRLTGFIGAIGGNIPQRYQKIAIPRGDVFITITVYELRRDAVLMDAAGNPIDPANRVLGEIPLTAIDTFNIILSGFRV
jgi:hypothetical protein